MRQIIISVFLILVILLTRTTYHIGENIEFITAISLCTAFFIGNKFSLVTIFLGLVLSDLVLGISSIMLFTWSGFLIPIIFSTILKKNANSFLFKLTEIQILGITSTLCFFLWTNLGVVLTTNMYSYDLYGLLNSYINGLPFLFNQLAGNLIIVPSLFLISMLLQNNQLNLKKLFQFKQNKLNYDNGIS